MLRTTTATTIITSWCVGDAGEKMSRKAEKKMGQRRDRNIKMSMQQS
jgi:hypothetical protein